MLGLLSPQNLVSLTELHPVSIEKVFGEKYIIKADLIGEIHVFSTKI